MNVHGDCSVPARQQPVQTPDPAESRLGVDCSGEQHRSHRFISRRLDVSALAQHLGEAGAQEGQLPDVLLGRGHHRGLEGRHSEIRHHQRTEDLRFPGSDEPLVVLPPDPVRPGTRRPPQIQRFTGDIQRL
ncbi:hypothetical protein ACGGAQ_22375 [Micromonospora sp. NPDC047557]|uniref:hypothetical protein n=1 Tax=Micromonospora sp. NPDC047557 TaxID=3364250 RepID=UPI00371CE512